MATSEIIKKAEIIHDLKRLENEWISVVKRVSDLHILSSQDMFELGEVLGAMHNLKSVMETSFQR